MVRLVFHAFFSGISAGVADGVLREDVDYAFTVSADFGDTILLYFTVEVDSVCVVGIRPVTEVVIVVVHMVLRGYHFVYKKSRNTVWIDNDNVINAGSGPLSSAPFGRPVSFTCTV